MIGIVVLLRRVWPLREGTNQRYRLATLIATLLFAIHGLVDVPGHRVGTAFAVIFLLGLSLHRPFALKSSPWLALLFRFVGLVLFLTGATWVVAARATMLLPGPVGASNAKRLASIANHGRNFPETIGLATRALEWAPLDWQLYFFRAIGEAELGQPEKALSDFRRARFLEPNAYEVPLAEGNLWLSSRPMLAVTAWREALRRAGPQRAEVYSSMLTNASMRSPAVARALEEIGLREHDLALAYLTRVSDTHFAHALDEFLKHDPNLRTLREEEKLALFSLWSERGDLDELARAVEGHPAWLEYAWLGMAKYYAQKKDFHSAYELTQRYGEPVALPRVDTNSSVQELEKRFAAMPNNYGVGYALYRAQRQSGRLDDALLTARHFSERAGAPPYFRFLEAQCWAEKGDWERAWSAWQAFQSATAPATR
jgi:tetratricopeptide (TPR) repeat protein